MSAGNSIDSVSDMLPRQFASTHSMIMEFILEQTDFTRGERGGNMPRDFFIAPHYSHLCPTCAVACKCIPLSRRNRRRASGNVSLSIATLGLQWEKPRKHSSRLHQRRHMRRIILPLAQKPCVCFLFSIVCI